VTRTNRFILPMTSNDLGSHYILPGYIYVSGATVT